MQKIYAFIALVSVIFLGGCSALGGLFSKESPSPVSGNWSYSIDSPQGIYTGTLQIVEGDPGELVIIMSQDGDNSADVVRPESNEFDEETQTLSFTFDNPEFGTMNVSMVLDEAGLSGTLHVVQFGMDVPILATRSDQ